jgi:hypothetical protein
MLISGILFTRINFVSEFDIETIDHYRIPQESRFSGGYVAKEKEERV